MTSNNKVVILDGRFQPYAANNPMPTASWNDSARNDAFQRLRVSQPQTIFDSKQIFDNAPLLYDDQEISGTGTTTVWDGDRASSIISVSSSTAGKRARQTFMRMNYQPGKSQLIFCTFVAGSSATGITKSVGYFDDDNGIFFRDNEGTLEMVIRSGVSGSTVENAVAQANWNIDRLDGTGASGITFDITKAQILAIDFEWLGVGRVRTGFVIDGQIFYVHQFNHANVETGVYMSTPNLPIRYEIVNDGTGVASDLEHICSTVMSEGGIEDNGILRHYNSAQLVNLTAGTKYIFMAGRLKSTHLGANIHIENTSVMASGQTDIAKWELISGGTVTGTLSFSDFANSAVQIADGDKTQTWSNGTGIVIDGGYFASNAPSTVSVPNALKLGSAIDGTPQEFYFVVTPVTNNITIQASITWREIL